jgi:hypothetical protein
MTILSSKLKTSLLAFALLAPSFAIAPVAIASDAPPATTSDWIPAGVEQLGRTAAFHTDFTFDRTMLQMASGLIDGGDVDTQKAIAKLDGVTVHLYRYAQPGMYDARQLDAIRLQYKTAGWKHLVSTQSHPTPTAPGQYAVGSEGHTDLFIKFQGTDVTGMVVMQASPRNLNVVALTGDLSPLDLLHLRGHFGIPKFSGDGFVPADN